MTNDDWDGRGVHKSTFNLKCQHISSKLSQNKGYIVVLFSPQLETIKMSEEEKKTEKIKR